MPPEIRVTLPDGSEKRLPAGSSGADLAQAIGPGLAKAALAVRLNGDIRDLARPLPDDVKVTILTDKDPQALEVLRHSSAHVLATAVRAGGSGGHRKKDDGGCEGRLPVCTRGSLAHRSEAALQG